VKVKLDIKQWFKDYGSREEKNQTLKADLVTWLQKYQKM
jgi:hypothetical protein